MNLDPALIDRVLNAIPYPIGKTNLVQLARQHGANDQILGILDKLPDKTFNSAQDVKSAFGPLGNLGGLGGLGGLFK